MPLRRTHEEIEAGHAHPTRAFIVESTAAIIKERGVGGLHMDTILERTKLTRGAVYHHFANVDDLVENALVSIYSEGVQANIDAVSELLGRARTFKDFQEGIRRANKAYALNIELRAIRTMRAHAISSAADSTRLASSLAGVQQKLTDAYVEMITGAQGNGWVRSSIDAETLAIFIQAYSFGIIVDDVSREHVDPESWALLIDDFFDRCVFEKSAPNE